MDDKGQGEEGNGAANIALFSGLADVYNANRPRPPEVLAEILARRAGVKRPALVVDIGCGTGHSALLWAGHARRVVGIEPNADMRRLAQARRDILPQARDVEIHDAKAWDTGLPAGCADIVTFSQSLHHMPPEPTLREAARLLRPGGVLAAYDHLMPPAISWEVEGVLEVFLERVEAMRRKRAEGQEATWWPKAEHVRRLRECGHFRQVRRFALHHRELGNRERLLGLVSSLSAVRALREAGVSEEEIGLPALRDALQPLLDDSLQAWFFDYRVVVGLRGEG